MRDEDAEDAVDVLDLLVKKCGVPFQCGAKHKTWDLHNQVCNPSIKTHFRTLDTSTMQNKQRCKET